MLAVHASHRSRSAAGDQVHRPSAPAEASLEKLTPQAQQTGELARAELVGLKAREELVVVARAAAIQTAARTAIAGGG